MTLLGLAHLRHVGPTAIERRRRTGHHLIQETAMTLRNCLLRFGFVAVLGLAACGGDTPGRPDA